MLPSILQLPATKNDVAQNVKKVPRLRRTVLHYKWNIGWTGEKTSSKINQFDANQMREYGLDQLVEVMRSG